VLLEALLPGPIPALRLVLLLVLVRLAGPRVRRSLVSLPGRPGLALCNLLGN
jgi:hypothetical protein